MLLGVVSVLAGAGLLQGLRHRYTVVTVRGESMSPTFRPGDRLLVRRTPIAAVRRGDCVVFAAGSAPRRADATTWMVKRAVAVHGDRVPRLRFPILRGSSERHVPAGHLLVLGDNQALSTDSRHFGYVAAERLLGVVLRQI